MMSADDIIRLMMSELSSQFSFEVGSRMFDALMSEVLNAFDHAYDLTSTRQWNSPCETFTQCLLGLICPTST